LNAVTKEEGKDGCALEKKGEDLYLSDIPRRERNRVYDKRKESRKGGTARH